MTPEIIAITGGIGAGKSVVSRILRTIGYPVYDSDSNAKILMDEDEFIKSRLVEEIDEFAVIDGDVNRARIAEIVFSDAKKLVILNDIVHGAVKNHFSAWCARQKNALVFIETAILFESGLNRMVDYEWRVVAPEELRVKRVMARNRVSEEDVRRRIASQAAVSFPDEPCPTLTGIVNDDRAAVLPQIMAALKTLNA